jgi:hypothetical protein
MSFFSFLAIDWFCSWIKDSFSPLISGNSGKIDWFCSLIINSFSFLLTVNLGITPNLNWLLSGDDVSILFNKILFLYLSFKFLINNTWYLSRVYFIWSEILFSYSW